eukprot:SAG11_NODE_34330_length_272_cov_1.190751_1_plen_74_part_01
MLLRTLDFVTVKTADNAEAAASDPRFVQPRATATLVVFQLPWCSFSLQVRRAANRRASARCKAPLFRVPRVYIG